MPMNWQKAQHSNEISSNMRKSLCYILKDRWEKNPLACMWQGKYELWREQWQKNPPRRRSSLQNSKDDRIRSFTATKVDESWMYSRVPAHSSLKNFIKLECEYKQSRYGTYYWRPPDLLPPVKIKKNDIDLPNIMAGSNSRQALLGYVERGFRIACRDWCYQRFHYAVLYLVSKLISCILNLFIYLYFLYCFHIFVKMSKL